MIKHRAWDHNEKKMYDHVNVLGDKNGLLEAIIFDYEHGGYDFTEVDLHTYESIWHYPEDEFPYEVLKGFILRLKAVKQSLSLREILSKRFMESPIMEAISWVVSS